MTHQGYLLMSDISGYTAFLTQSELEHGQDILKNLWDSLLKTIKKPLVIAEFEGDALFMYASSNSFLQAQTLVEMVESQYVQFADTRDRMSRNTTCQCTACMLIPTLDLKFIVHHGTFVLQQVIKDRQEKPSGPDVILIHRLLKNTIVERTGIKAYALFTDTAAAASGMGELAGSMRRHSETYEHLGEIQGCLLDMHSRLAMIREARHIRVERQQAQFVLEADVPVPPPVAWDYLNEPARKAQWLGAHSISVLKRAAGRVDVGSVHHCAHGKGEVVEFEILDWRPFEYVTFAMPFPLTKGICRFTLELSEMEGGTHLAWIISSPEAPTRLHNLIAKTLSSIMKPIMKKTFAECLGRVRTMIQNDLAAGKIAMPSGQAA